MTLNDNTNEDKDDSNQLTSDVNSWRHCPDCFFCCGFCSESSNSLRYVNYSTYDR